MLTVEAGSNIKIAKVKGEFVWHSHENEDELFLVLSGRLDIELRDTMRFDGKFEKRLD